MTNVFGLTADELGRAISEGIEEANEEIRKNGTTEIKEETDFKNGNHNRLDAYACRIREGELSEGDKKRIARIKAI